MSDSSSLVSSDNDESDFESYCSFDNDLKNDLRNLQTTGYESSCSSGYDSLSLGDFSRQCSLNSPRSYNSPPLAQLTYVNDFTPIRYEDTLDGENHNINKTRPNTSGTKKFYVKPNISIVPNISIGDLNGNSPCNVRSSSSLNSLNVPTCSSLSGGYISDDDNLSDIEHRIAETLVKMNDAILSNGREEINLHNRKLKQHCLEKELKDSGIERSAFKKPGFNFQKNSNNNNNNIIYKNQQEDKIEMNLKLVGSRDDNRYSSLPDLPDSPIVDAYEKECLDVPEKMVRELEKENLTKEDEGPANKKEKIEIFKEKMNEEDEKEADESSSEADDLRILVDTKKERSKSLKIKGSGK